MSVPVQGGPEVMSGNGTKTERLRVPLPEEKCPGRIIHRVYPGSGNCELSDPRVAQASCLLNDW